jgi:hypothetical protein
VLSPAVGRADKSGLRMGAGSSGGLAVTGKPLRDGRAGVGLVNVTKVDGLVLSLHPPTRRVKPKGGPC